ncbi:MAG: hypothetical protein KC621_04435 [Myxococcales bacterium]|nr:hypothetical protein [Myxococcales bacterium]
MKVKLLEQRHPSYDGSALAQGRALYCGGKEWRALVEPWLPRHPDETDTMYQARKERALYTNHAGPICDVLGAAVFAEAPTVEDLTGEWVGTW